MSASPLFKEIIFAETKDMVISETMPLDWVATVAKKAENEAAEGAAGAWCAPAFRARCRPAPDAVFERAHAQQEEGQAGGRSRWRWRY